MLSTTYRTAVASRLAMPRPTGTIQATTPRNSLHTLTTRRPRLNVTKNGTCFGPPQNHVNKPSSRSYAQDWNLGRATPVVHGLLQEITKLQQGNEELKLLLAQSRLMMDDSKLLMEKSNLSVDRSILAIDQLAAREKTEKTVDRISYWALLFGGFGICSAVYFWRFPPVREQQNILEKGQGGMRRSDSNAASRGHVNSDACMGEGGRGDDCCALHILQSMKS